MAQSSDCALRPAALLKTSGTPHSARFRVHEKMTTPRFLAATVLALTIQLFVTSPPKAATVQEGYCAGWPDLPDKLKSDGYRGLFSSLSFSVNSSNYKKAQELTDDLMPGHKMTRLETLDLLLYTAMHVNTINAKTHEFTTEEEKSEFLYHTHKVIELESQNSFPLTMTFFITQMRIVSFTLYVVLSLMKRHKFCRVSGGVLQRFSRM
jgi:hypothetical protein